MPDRIRLAASKANHIGPLSPLERTLDDPSGLLPAAGTLQEGEAGLKTLVRALLKSGTNEPTLESIGKPISDLLGRAFTHDQGGLAGTAGQVPKRFTLSNWNSGRKLIELFGTSKANPKLEVSPADLDALIEGGTVSLDQPPQGTVDAIRRRLSRALGPNAQDDVMNRAVRDIGSPRRATLDQLPKKVR